MLRKLFITVSLVVVGLYAFANQTTSSKLEAQLRANLKIEKYQLENGLTLVMHVDDRVPMVSYHQWFHVGSSNEKKGRTGLAHFFEHLMFKGSKNYSSEKYENFINSNGGYNNAFTTRDYTGYYTLIPSDRLHDIIKIEADRMSNLIFDEKEIQSEREVVKEERRYRYDNDPDGTLYLRTNETVFQTGPYSWPVIGYMKDLNAAKLSELQDFYKTFYAPNNATVVIVGAFDPKEAKKWVEQTYGSIPRQKIPELKDKRVPEQKSPRVVTEKMDVQAPKINLAYKTANNFEDDTYPLQTLASLLAGGPSSRLYKSLVREKQLVTQVSADQDSDELEGVFTISVDLRPKKSRGAVLSEINRQIHLLQTKLVDASELEKVKNEVLLNYTRLLKSTAGKARVLAYSEITYKDPTKFFEDLDKYSKVSAEDIRRVAKKYLNKNQRSIISILPKK